jgi:hypothetical protein
MVISPQFEIAGGLVGGLAKVVIDKKWGYINKAGKVVIEPQYDDARDFSEGLAAVKTSDGWGFVDMNGTFVVKAQYYDVGFFSEGLAVIRLSDGKCGYIDRTGHLVLNPQVYFRNEPCREGVIHFGIRRPVLTPNFPDTDRFTTRNGIIRYSGNEQGHLYYNCPVLCSPDFIAGVTIQVDKMKDKGAFGMIFRQTADRNTYYAFLISGVRFSVIKSNNNKVEVLCDMSSEALATKKNEVALTVRCNGRFINCYLWDKMVAEIEDKSNNNEEKYVGIAAFGKANCRFSDFVMAAD